MKTVRILILEDDLKTLSILINRLESLEEYGTNIDVAVTVLSEYMQVEEYINKTEMNFDCILLDRDCKACGSFHVLDFEKFGVDKIISISSVPEWNKEAAGRGVKNVVLKDYENLEVFTNEVLVEVRKIIL
jgi:hypothetical protein